MGVNITGTFYNGDPFEYLDLEENGTSGINFFNYTTDSFDGANVQNLSIIGIENAQNLNFYINSSNTRSNSRFSSIFTGVRDLNDLENTNNITGMNFSFYGLINLVNIPNFNTSNVTNMSYMFVGCNNLINIPNFDVSNVTDMSGMLFGCDNLINVSNFNTVNVVNMSEMFLNCKSLVSVPNFDTPNVSDMYRIFGSCYNLTNIPNFNTINVVNMGAMYHGCNNLVNAPSFNTINVTDMGYMYSDCVNLINIPILDMSSVTNISRMFTSCSNLSNKSLVNIAKSLPNVSQLTSQDDSLSTIGLSSNQISYLSTTKYASTLQAKGWDIEDNYVEPKIVKTLNMKLADGTMDLAVLSTDAEYIDMEDGTTLEETIQNLKEYIDSSISNILGGSY